MPKSALTRRQLLRAGAIGGIGWIAPLHNPAWLRLIAQAAPIPADPQQLTPEAALEKLMSGNRRFVRQHLQHPDQSSTRLGAVAQAQHPFATILSCADSRVPAEILFDQGIGDLFNVRIAGNVATPAALGSLEYAATLLEAPILMVLGHERCGAVTAAVKGQALPGEMGRFVQAILPALDKTKALAGDPVAQVDQAVTANVRYQIEQLRRSDLLNERVQAGQLKIVGGRYDLDTGVVEIIA